jgi:molybdenum cofactor cytidylyltransferase
MRSEVKRALPGLIVLAAGQARRFGADKLLAQVGGVEIAQCVAECSGTFDFSRKVCVVRAGAPQVEAIFATRGFTIVVNARPEQGMAQSLKLGLAELREAPAVFVLLGDMPLIPEAVFSRLWRHLRREGLDAIRPSYDGRPGHPVLLASSCFERLEALSGDTGAARIFQNPELKTLALAFDDPGLVQDVDTPEDLQALSRG